MLCVLSTLPFFLCLSKGATARHNSIRARPNHTVATDFFDLRLSRALTTTSAQVVISRDTIARTSSVVVFITAAIWHLPLPGLSGRVPVWSQKLSARGGKSSLYLQGRLPQLRATAVARVEAFH